MPKRILSVLIAAALSAGIFTGCSSPQYEIELYDGNYSEVQLVHKMVELLVEDRTDIESHHQGSDVVGADVPGTHPGRTPAATSCVPMMARY